MANVRCRRGHGIFRESAELHTVDQGLHTVSMGEPYSSNSSPTQESSTCCCASGILEIPDKHTTTQAINQSIHRDEVLPYICSPVSLRT